MHVLIAGYLVWCFVMVPWCVGVALRIEGVRKHTWYLGDTAWYGLSGCAGVLCVDAFGLIEVTWWDVFSPMVFAVVLMFVCYGIVKSHQASRQKPYEDFGMVLGCVVLLASLIVAALGWVDILGLSKADPVEWRILWPVLGVPFVLGTFLVAVLILGGVCCLFTPGGLPPKVEPQRKEPQQATRRPATGWSENFGS